MTAEPICPTCDGSGLVPATGQGGDGTDYCPTCEGEGHLWKNGPV